MNETNFFNIQGGRLSNPDSYVSRKADEELLNYCLNYQNNNPVVFLLAPRQMGKTSLVYRTQSHLKTSNIASVLINVHLWDGINEETLWTTLLFKIIQSFSSLKEIESEINRFWNYRQDIVDSERFIYILLEYILPNISANKVVIFMDEIQSLVRLKIQDVFIRFLKILSETNHENVQKINFVLVGVAKPFEFITNSDTRFVGQSIDLECLSGDCLPLQQGLKSITNQPHLVIKRVLYWTGGQPFLTQYACSLLSQNFPYSMNQNFDEQVDRIIQDQYIKNWRSQDQQSHLTGIENYFVKIDDSQTEYKFWLLNYYEMILRKEQIQWEDNHKIQEELFMSGLIVKTMKNNQNYLKVANFIYQNIFNYEWIDQMRERVYSGEVSQLSIPKANLKSEDLSYLDVITYGCNILAKELKPFVEQRMDKFLGEEWRNNSEIRNIIRPLEDESPLTIVDHCKLLNLIVYCWDDVFTHVFNMRDKSEVEALLNFCNKTKKEETDIDHNLVIRVLNTIVYLLRTIGSSDQVQGIDELMMNKYPEMADSFLDKNHNNTLGYKAYQHLLSQEENNMVAVAVPVTTSQIDNHQIISNTMDKSIYIAKILNQRHPRAKKVQALINKLNSLLSQLDSMETLCSRLSTTIPDASVTGNLSLLFSSFVAIKAQIKKVKKTLDKLDKRFSREKLTIAFVGRAGQGKSRFIQALTGLTKTEVPDGTINNCTGVKVVIAHSSDSETRGEVLFYTPNSFLQENIIPYYPVLRLGAVPSTLEQFINNSLPELDETLSNSPKAKAYYQHLEKCQTYYPEYKDLLQGNSSKLIGKDEIRKYVSQTDENNQRTNFSYLAVREVRIYCEFPHGDVGQIALIDLPGLGDTVLGDKETLRRSLGEDVDFALFVSMPKGRILQEEDYDLFEIANQALPDLPIEKWSFMVLNEVRHHTPGLGVQNNGEVCQATKESIIRDNRIKLADEPIIADCADPSEASQVLLQVLNYLETHILELDAQYGAIANKSIEQLEGEAKAFLEKSRQAFRVTPKYQNENLVFYNLAKELTTNINRNLQRLIKEIRPETLIIEENQKDTEFFQTATRNIVKECLKDTGVHSVERIDEMRFEIGAGQGWIAILQKCVNELRNHISKKFNSFDSGFEIYVEQVKEQIADALTNTNLGNITTVRGIEFLGYMSQEIPVHLSVLKEAFEKIVSFKMTYEYHLEHLILQALEEELDPNVVGNVFDPVGKSDEENIELIHKILLVKHRNTISKCRQALEKLEGMPSIIVYGRANRFVDAVSYSEKIDTDWLVLLQEWSSQVFPDQFGKGISQEKQEWENCIQEAFSLSKLERI
jgi:hypothetical protein